MAHTLLLADDSVTIQRVIELTFADEDIHVVAVSDGDEAIAVLDKSPPDIVLADVGMPGKNGYEVAQHIKATPRLAHIPVVLLTGAFEPIDQARAAAAGCEGVLAKPFEPQLVIGRVKELLARPKTLAPTDPPPPVPAAAWRTPPPAPFVEPQAPAAAVKGLGAAEYFERLHQEMAGQSIGQAEIAKGARVTPAVAEAIDWFASDPPTTAQSSTPAIVDRWDIASTAPLAELPLAYTPPAPFSTPAPLPFLSTPVPFAVTPAPPFFSTPAPPGVVAPPPVLPPLPALPPLADAFAALLAAEQSAPAPIAAPAWPALPQPSAPAATVGDEVIEEVVRRVLDRLSDRVVRETVAEHVSTVAERLVREEIEGIKKTIK